MTCVVTHVPSGRCVRNCPSRRPRRISKTKNGLPSDFSAIFAGELLREVLRAPEASREQADEVLRPEPRERDARRVLDRGRGSRATSRRARARGPDEQDPVPRHGERERREERAALLGREVEVVDQDDRRPLRRERPRRVDEARLERVLRQRLRARRRRVAAQQRRERGDEQRRLRERRADRRLVVAEVLAVRRRERARRRRRAAGRVAAEEEVHVLARCASRPTNSSTSRDFPIPASPSTRTTRPSPAFAASKSARSLASSASRP